MRVVPCKDCKKRSIHCHSQCKDYIEWQDEWTKVKEIMRESKKPAIESARHMDYLWRNTRYSKLRV